MAKVVQKLTGNGHKLTDTARLDLLERFAEHGAIPGLISDGQGHWAVTVLDAKALGQVARRIIWYPSVREALDAELSKGRTVKG